MTTAFSNQNAANPFQFCYSPNLATDQDLECGICSTPYSHENTDSDNHINTTNNNRLNNNLPIHAFRCAHTVCSQCLSGMAAHRQATHWVDCPFCRKENAFHIRQPTNLLATKLLQKHAETRLVISALEARNQGLSDKANLLESMADSSKALSKEVAEENENLQAEVFRLQDSVKDYEQANKEKEEAWKNKSIQVMKCVNQVKELEAQIESLRTENKQLVETKEKLDDDIKLETQSRVQLEVAMKDLETKHDSLKSKNNELETNLATQVMEFQALQQKHQVMRNKVYDLTKLQLTMDDQTRLLHGMFWLISAIILLFPFLWAFRSQILIFFLRLCNVTSLTL